MTALTKKQLAVLAAVIAFAMAGCGGEGGPGGGKRIPHLRTITTLYFTAVSALGGPPQDEQQFKAEIVKIKPDFDVLDISSIDELFISDRDGQPLVIVYGKDAKGKTPEIVAYEQTGVDGKRLVGNRAGQVTEADAAEFAKLVPARKP